MYKSLILNIVFFCFLTACSKVNTYAYKGNPNEKILCQIHFQENFKNDLMILSVGGDILREDIRLNTIEKDGICKLVVEFVESSEIGVFSISLYSESVNNSFLKHEDEFTDLNGNLSFTITLNGLAQNFSIDLKKGKYIGFSKQIRPNSNELILNQSKYQFSYD